MKSPRFPQRAQVLERVLTQSRLKDTWKKKVRDALRRHFVPDPVEHLDFHVELPQRCRALTASIIEGSYRPGTARRILVEKSKGLCRQIVLPRPEDALVLQVLADVLWSQVKQRQPSPNAFFEPAKQPFSKRVTSREAPYGSLRAWLDFQRTVIGFAHKHHFLIITDISNYYDNIGFLELRQVLSSLAHVDQAILELLLHILSSMTWQPDYAGHRAVGLPQIDLDAPRVLAHCFLFELDQFIMGIADVDYARYMDDINIGCSRRPEAKRILRDVDLTLQTRQLRLNSGKTMIMSEREAMVHFRVRENAALDRIDRRVEKILCSSADQSAQSAQERIRNRWRRTVERTVERERFEGGNGEKILKRMLTLALRLETPISENALMRIILERPALRERAFQVLNIRPLNVEGIKFYCKILDSTELVDDASLVMLVRSLVARVCTDSERRVTAAVRHLAHKLGNHGPWSLLAKVIVSAKFGSPKDILDILRRSRAIWEVDPIVARWAGALLPKLQSRKVEKSYSSLVAQSSSVEERAVYDFHRRIVRDPSVVKAVLPFVNASNPSEPTGITLGKWLLLLTVLRSDLVAPKVKEEICGSHSRAWKDVIFRTEAKRAFPNWSGWPRKANGRGSNSKVAAVVSA